jgi:hypothetical protein
MKDRDKPLVLLIETESPGEVEIIRSKLEAFGIPCSVWNESAGHLFGITLDGLARTRIYVPEEFLELAREALKPGITDPAEDS